MDSKTDQTWTQEKINSVNEPMGELFKITESSIKRAEESISKFLKKNKLKGDVESYRNLSFKPHKWTCGCGKEFTHGNSAYFHVHMAKRPCCQFDYQCSICGETGFKSVKEILIHLFTKHEYDNKEVKRKSVNYLKKKEKISGTGSSLTGSLDSLGNLEHLTINPKSLTLDQLHNISNPENILYRGDEEQLLTLEKQVVKFLKRHGLGEIGKLRNIPFPKGKSFSCLCGKVYKTGNSVYYHLNNMKNPCGMLKFKCLICDKGGIENRESLFLHLFDSHEYDRNKVLNSEEVERRLSNSPDGEVKAKVKKEKKEKKSKPDKLPESRRRKKVDYSGMGDEDGVNDDVNNDTLKRGNKRGAVGKKSKNDDDFSADDKNEDKNEDSDDNMSEESGDDTATPEESGADSDASMDSKNDSKSKVRSNSRSQSFQSTPKCTFTSLDSLTINSYSKFHSHWNKMAAKIKKPAFEDQELGSNPKLPPIFTLQKPNSEERSESSFPFLYYDEDDKDYSIVNFGDQIESSKNSFSMFVGLNVIQSITIHDKFIATLAHGHIDFFYEKEAKTSKTSGFSFKFLGRYRNLEAEDANFTRMQVPKFGENPDDTTMAVGRSDGKILILKLKLAEKNVGGEIISILGNEKYDDDGVFEENDDFEETNEQTKIKRENLEQKQIKLDQTSKTVLEIDFSSSNKFLAASLANGNINIYSLSDFELITVLHAHEKKCRAVAFCPFNDYLIASGGYDRCLVMYDWHNNPDFPVEHLDVAHSGSVYTSLVWPFSAPAVFAGTENCFAADRLHGVQTYWMGSPQIIDSPMHIFACRDTIWDIAYQPWKHSMVACDDSGSVYLSVLSNMRRRWGVTKANHSSRAILFSTCHSVHEIEQKKLQIKDEKTSQNNIHKLHPDLRSEHQQKHDFEKQLRRRGVKITFKTAPLDSLKNFTEKSEKLNDFQHYDFTGAREKLEMPARSFGVISVSWCLHKDRSDTVVVLTKQGVIRILKVPLP